MIFEGLANPIRYESPTSTAAETIQKPTAVAISSRAASGVLQRPPISSLRRQFATTLQAPCDVCNDDPFECHGHEVEISQTRMFSCRVLALSASEGEHDQEYDEGDRVPERCNQLALLPFRLWNRSGRIQSSSGNSESIRCLRSTSNLVRGAQDRRSLARHLIMSGLLIV